MNINIKKVTMSIALIAGLSGLFISTTVSAQNWNKRTVVKHGHHKVVINQHCRGNARHRVCRENVRRKPVRNHHPRRQWRYWW